jgi:hypothetical protein
LSGIGGGSLRGASGDLSIFQKCTRTANNNSVRLLKKLQEFGSFNLLRNLPEFFQENFFGIFSGIFRNIFR